MWEALFTVAGTKVGLLDAARLGLWQANLDRAAGADQGLQIGIALPAAGLVPDEHVHVAGAERCPRRWQFVAIG